MVWVVFIIVIREHFERVYVNFKCLDLSQVCKSLEVMLPHKSINFFPDTSAVLIEGTVTFFDLFRMAPHCLLILMMLSAAFLTNNSSLL